MLASSRFLEVDQDQTKILGNGEGTILPHHKTVE